MDDFLTSLLECSAAETIEALWEGRDRLEADDFEELMLALNNVADQVELHSDMILKDAQRGIDAKTKSMKDKYFEKIKCRAPSLRKISKDLRDCTSMLDNANKKCFEVFMEGLETLRRCVGQATELKLADFIDRFN